MNTVEVDAAALEAEAAAAVAQHSTPAGASEATDDDRPPTGGASPENIVEGYRLISLALIDRGAQVLTPAWTWRPERKANIATAAAQALYLWFGEMPIPPKYMAVLVLAGAVMEVVDDNRDPTTGKLRPFSVPPAPAAKPVAASN